MDGSDEAVARVDDTDKVMTKVCKNLPSYHSLNCHFHNMKVKYSTKGKKPLKDHIECL